MTTTTPDQIEYFIKRVQTRGSEVMQANPTMTLMQAHYIAWCEACRDLQSSRPEVTVGAL